MSTWVFPSPSFILRSMIHLELIFVDGVRKGLVFIFFHTFTQKKFSFVKDRRASYVWVWLWSLSCSQPRPPVPRGLATLTSVALRHILGQVVLGQPPALPVFSKMALPFPDPWPFEMDFSNPPPGSHGEVCWGSDGTVPSPWTPPRRLAS